MSDDNKIYKSSVFDFDVSATDGNYTAPAYSFSTQDLGGTARLVFNVNKENVDLPLSSAASAKMAMQMADGSRYVVNPLIFDSLKGQITYSLTDDQLTHSGAVQAELYISYPNQGVQVHRFNFTINKALIDSDIAPIITYYVQTWEEWEAYFQSRMDELDQKLAGLQTQADNLQTQFDSFEPSQFVQQTDFLAHTSNTEIHVTAEEKTAWDAKETTEGAQEKADKALSDAKIYTDSFTDNYGPWINVPLASGFSTGDSNPPQYRLKQVNTNEGIKTFAEFRGAIAGTFISTANSTVATMPAGTRPTVTEYCAAASNNGNNGRIAIPTNGQILQVSSTDNANPSYVGLSEILYEVGN
ncbi:BppU family phage baseplate upper protein [Listeria seeligeri]|uniref:BppU family phage baseplate upper protein n=1 Tax=Listeria seeligeri TaxID=1640 RepID=UPI0022EBF2FC|nr:BppU family phage baseplate upper protein [Listeria seeligeri]EJR2826470.1 BppU family phage baseplate upper protein [Listeria monocytogenes]